MVARCVGLPLNLLARGELTVLVWVNRDDALTGSQVHQPMAATSSSHADDRIHFSSLENSRADCPSQTKEEVYHIHQL